MPVQPNKAIVGSNAFAHSSGIHQDGVLKDRATYEIVAPQTVGFAGHKLVLTPRSGRHALGPRLQELGYARGGAAPGRSLQRFLEVADARRSSWTRTWSPWCATGSSPRRSSWN